MLEQRFRIDVGTDLKISKFNTQKILRERDLHLNETSHVTNL